MTKLCEARPSNHVVSSFKYAWWRARAHGTHMHARARAGTLYPCMYVRTHGGTHAHTDGASEGYIRVHIYARMYARAHTNTHR